jgi:hypothetical protein
MAALGLAFAGFAGCVGYVPGLAVPVRVAASDGGPLEAVWMGDGTELALEALSVEIERIELVPAGGSGHVHHALLRLLGPPRAAAQHHHASPLVIEGPWLVPLDRPATELPAAFEPAPGRYDRVIATLGGLVLAGWAEGRYLSARSTRRFEARADLEPPLVLGPEGGAAVTLTLAEAAPFALLAALPEGALDGDAVLAGMAAQSHVAAEP